MQAACVCEKQKPFSVLFVDDNEGIRNLIVSIFRSLIRNRSIKLHVAKNGLEAFNLFYDSMVSGENIDLVMTDNDMDQMTGDVLVKEIKQSSPNTPVVLLTADTQLVKNTKMFDRVISKPFSVNSVIAIVEKYLAA